MKKNKIILLVFSLSFLVACNNGGEDDMPKTVNVEEKANEESSSDVDIASISDYLFEKLDSQKLVRNYGEDTGWTNLEFTEDGNFTGSYFGKIKNDGYDGGLTEYAWNWHRGEEIHTSDFKGKFKIIEKINEYVYKMKLDSFEITSENGRYDDIYINVDFALGIKPDADYYLYIPGTPAKYLPGEDSRLDNNYKKEDEGEDKTQGFIIWNKYQDEVFNQLSL
ncbi:hypothetical protein [uncultured Anaerococcus sp.]|uniref:hypothetical protein n=1 Tax=uncultured Anaerococcus sp. TaxID=293428 RepID=UPI0026036523|nr:hypothetical protein [uncultured Anaerococcus sp.]